MPEVSKPQVPYFGEARSAAATGASAAGGAAPMAFGAFGAPNAGVTPSAAMAAAASRMFRRAGIIGVSRDARNGGGQVQSCRAHQETGNFDPAQALPPPVNGEGKDHSSGSSRS